MLLVGMIWNVHKLILDLRFCCTLVSDIVIINFHYPSSTAALFRILKQVDSIRGDILARFTGTTSTSTIIIYKGFQEKNLESTIEEINPAVSSTLEVSMCHNCVHIHEVYLISDL